MLRGVWTVNARELHEFLGVKRDFSNWVKGRIEKFGFVEDADYITDAKIGVGGKFGSVDYHISIDMAKELSMD
jgi:phage anti-repressor protein